MFRIQNWKQALGLMALGSAFAIIGMLISPVTAQRDKFGEIECRKLTIVDANGKNRIIITADSGDMVTNVHRNLDKRVVIHGTSIGGGIDTYGKNGYASATLSSSIDGEGYLSVFDKNGYPQVNLDVNDKGEGVITVGEEDKPEVMIGGSEHGGRGLWERWKIAGEAQ